MSSEEPTVAAETAPEPVSAEPAEEDPPVKGGKAKKAKETKAKKAPAPRKPRNPPSHPPYVEVLFVLLETWRFV